MSVLRPFTPRFYQTLGKPLVNRTVEDLSTFRNLYFQTDLGIIDILRTVPPIASWEEISTRAVELPVHQHSLRVIGLDDLIAVKRHVRRAKDLVVAAELEAVRERRNAPPDDQSRNS